MPDPTSPVDTASIPDDEVPFVMPPDIVESVPEGAGTIPLMGGISTEEMEKTYQARLEKLGAANFITSVRTPGSYDNILYFSITKAYSEPDRIQDAVALISPDAREQFDYRLIKDGKVILGPNVIGNMPGAGETVSGVSGIVEMLSTRKGKIRRVPLYNSGFYIDIRAPSPDELNILINRCQLDTNEYGRSYGAHFYLYFDLILKEHFITMIMNMVVNASHKDFKTPGVLMQSIKLQDFNALITSVAALMYPDGYDDFKHICTRPHTQDHPNGCDHVETVKIDLTKMIKTNFQALNPNAVQHMVKARNLGTPVTTDEIKAYQIALGYDGQTVIYDTWRFTLTTPSLSDYMEAGALFNQDILNEVQADNTQGIYNSIAFREMRPFIPWIARVDALNDDGTVSKTTLDKTVISFILDQTMLDPKYREGLRSKLLDYINKTQLTHICYPVFACPACGYEPHTKTGFFTVDPQNSFFTLAFQRLMQNS